MALLEALYPLTEVSRFRRRYDDDFVDRLNNRYSTFIFIVLGIIISTRQYVGDPITCWSPAQFSHEWIEYVNKICWISNTYYASFDQPIPANHEKGDLVIPYYQWVPILIFLQAMFFFAPSMIWKKLNCQSGIHVNKIVSVVGGAEHGSPEIRDKTINYVVRNLDRALRSQQEYRTGCFADCRQRVSKTCFIIYGKRYGNFLVTLYLFVKILYITNAVAQIFMLNEFLDTTFHMYGINVMNDLYNGKTWTAAKHFPRVTLCDFKVRGMGNLIRPYTVQCALPINLFNEKIYIFIWFWLVFVGLVTILNFLSWLWTLFRRNRRDYVKKYLRIMHRNFGTNDASPSKQFCEDYLRQDGIFVLRLISKNTNDVVVGEIIQALWKYYKKHNEKTEHV